mgnify:CR=1 FL=1
MDSSAAKSYIYAKASGLIGKSFTGERTSLLFTVKSLGELWTLIFNTQPPLLPEVLLARQIESEAFSILIKQYVYFLNQFDKKQRILELPLLLFDSDNLKTVGAALCAGEKDCPPLSDLGEFSRFNFSAWPDIAKITEGTEFSWYNQVVDMHEQQKNDYRIDIQTVQYFWKQLHTLSGYDYEILVNLFKTEYTLKNIVWALRLKSNYQMQKEEIINNLIYVTDSPSKDDPIAAPALAILDKELDSWEQWQNWRYACLLNPHTPGEIWSVDPIWIEGKGRIKFTQMARRVFHQNPMSISSIIGWFKVKAFELSCIRTAVESLRLGISKQEAMNTVGVIER